MRTHYLYTIAVVALTSALFAAPQRKPALQQPVPRTANGKPKLQGIWQASSTAAADLQDHAARNNMLAGRSVVVSTEIPYQQRAAAKKAENFRNRQKADPLSQCYMPGVPRIMYLDFPFQIFQTPQAIAMTFEWSLVYRLIHTDGMSNHVLSLWLLTSTTSVSPSHRPRESPIQASMSLGCGLPRHDSVRSNHRGFESFHEAVDHPAPFVSATRSGQAFRVRLSG